MNFLFNVLGADVGKVLRRFPLAIVSAAALTLVAICISQGWLPVRDETIYRIMLGLLNFTIFALAGQLFRESRPRGDRGSMAVAFVLPAVALFAPLVADHKWLVPELIPLVGIFWLSLSAFAAPQPRLDTKDVQDRFWWLNHRAATTGAIALIGLGLVMLGFLAIERSLAILFGLELSRFIYGFLVPLTGMFLMPVYWFATIPELDEFDADYLEKPDFLSRAVGFLGQFVLSPLLLAYALILLAYTVQIVLTWQLPQGVLGWMVLAFTITGAANWLVLFPRFMNDQLLVRLFKSAWFWLTLLPLMLYALAVFVRVSSYGLTEERYLLIAGGTWALLLAIVFLSRRFADIRIIPALAGMVFLLLSIGPWNLINLPNLSQLWRLQTALSAAQPNVTTVPEWTSETAADARSAARFLDRNDTGRDYLAAELVARGIISPSGTLERGDLLVALDLPPGSNPDAPSYQTREFDFTNEPIDVATHPHLYGNFNVSERTVQFVAGTQISLKGNRLVLTRDGNEIGSKDLSDWARAQQPDYVNAPEIIIETNENSYRLVPLRINMVFSNQNLSEPNRITDMLLIALSGKG